MLGDQCEDGRCAVAFYHKKRKIGFWRALDCATPKTCGWVLGRRNVQTFKTLSHKLKAQVAMFYTDYWAVDREVISGHNLTQGKGYTVGIERGNLNIGHYLASMTGEGVSKSDQMIGLSLSICSHLNENGLYQNIQKQILTIF